MLGPRICWHASKAGKSTFFLRHSTRNKPDCLLQFKTAISFTFEVLTLKRYTRDGANFKQVITPDERIVTSTGTKMFTVIYDRSFPRQTHIFRDAKLFPIGRTGKHDFAKCILCASLVRCTCGQTSDIKHFAKTL